MNLKRELQKRFLIRLIIGIVPLVFFIVALFTARESGNSGMSLNLEKFVPATFFIAWETFLIVEALILFVKHRIKDGLMSIYAASLLGMIFIVSLYVEHQY